MNYEYQETFEYSPEMEGEFSHEMNEYELAHELLGVQNEQEMEYFLGNLLKSAWSGAKTLYNSPLGQQLKGQAISGLKSLGRQVLPGLGSSLGGRFLGDRGARWGGQLGNMAVRGLGLEFEGASPDERRVEGSRRIIRIARESGRRIAAYAKSGKPISARVVRQIILRVARRWFPSLPMPGGGTGMGNSFSQSSGGSSNTGGQNRGTWVRQGNRIILQGA